MSSQELLEVLQHAWVVATWKAARPAKDKLARSMLAARQAAAAARKQREEEEKRRAAAAAEAQRKKEEAVSDSLRSCSLNLSKLRRSSRAFRSWLQGCLLENSLYQLIRYPAASDAIEIPVLVSESL